MQFTKKIIDGNYRFCGLQILLRAVPFKDSIGGNFMSNTERKTKPEINKIKMRMCVCVKLLQSCLTLPPYGP